MGNAGEARRRAVAGIEFRILRAELRGLRKNPQRYSVFPEVPVRQWVLSLPFALRYRLAYDASAVSVVLRIFVRAIFGSLRRRARDNGIHNGQCGAVTFIQRFGSALNLNVDFHVIVLDGVYACIEEKEQPRFYPLRQPENADVLKVAAGELSLPFIRQIRQGRSSNVWVSRAGLHRLLGRLPNPYLKNCERPQWNCSPGDIRSLVVFLRNTFQHQRKAFSYPH